MVETVEQGRSPVAVVVVAWNAATYLTRCLESVEAMQRPPAEITVVDNGSSDGSAELVARDFSRVTLIRNSGNLGFCRANNLAIRRTVSPYVLVLNPDTRLDPLFLERLLPAFDDARVGMAAGKLLRFDGRTLDSAGQMLGRSRQPKDRGYGRLDNGRFERDEEVFGVCAAAALYRREMLDSIADPDGSYFDPDFFAFCEDMDLAWRARRLGWKAVYRHRAVGYHARGGSARSASRLGRLAAMLRRDPEIRFHVAKNRYLMMLRNDRRADYLRNLPFILARDLATVALLLTTPGVLLRLWRERSLFGRALARRQLDAARPRHHVGPGEAPGRRSGPL